MSTTGQTTMSEVIAQRGRQARSTADSAIRGLAEIADDLEMRETADKLRQTQEQLRSDTFKLIIMGRFKNGKSTLLNALLGGTTKPVVLEGHKGPMVVDDLPATATLTGVRYAEDAHVQAWGFDGKAEMWSFAKYLRESTLGTDELESQRRFQAIKEFEMGYPARLCKEGVIVYDSPGLDEHTSRTVITREATKRCDAAVIVYRSDILMGQSELVDAASVVAEGTRLFTAVNLWNGRRVDERLRSFVWNRYVRDHGGGPAWNNQEFSQRDIYFIDADQARDGRYDNDEDSVEASGLADFERALAKFLVDERQQVHLQKFTTLAGNYASVIDVQILQRQKAAQQDQEQLKAAYAEQLPKLAEIRSYPAKLAKIFARYRADAEVAMTSSFATLVARIRAELPGHLRSIALPSGEKYTKVLHQKKLQAEAAAAITDFVTTRVETWGNQDVMAELAPALDRLFDEIDNEITAIARRFDEIHVSLGWGGLDTSGPVVRPSERILAAAAGLILGGGGGAITGGAGGWRGTAGSIAGVVATSFVLTVVGVTSAVIFFPAMLAAALAMGIIAGGVDLERRVKDKALEQSDQMLARMPEESQPGIAENVEHYFKLLETTITEDVRAFIDGEERNIARAVELNQSEQAERDRSIAALSEAAAVLARERLALQQSLVIARQT
jgi:hypothetical protein